jgi:hypothetical protein
MAVETIAILRSILFQLETAETLEDAKSAVKVMCSKDDIAAVEQEVLEYLKRKKKTT